MNTYGCTMHLRAKNLKRVLNRATYGKSPEKQSDSESEYKEEIQFLEGIDTSTKKPTLLVEQELEQSWMRLATERKRLDERETLLEHAEEKQRVMDAKMAEWFKTNGDRDAIEDFRKAEEDYPDTPGGRMHSKNIGNATDEELMQVLEGRQMLVDVRKTRAEGEQYHRDLERSKESKDEGPDAMQRPTLGLKLTPRRAEPFDSTSMPEQIQRTEYAKAAKIPRKKKRDGERDERSPKTDEEDPKTDPEDKKLLERMSHDV